MSQPTIGVPSFRNPLMHPTVSVPLKPRGFFDPSYIS